MSSKNKKDVVFGNFELDPNEFAPENVKVRITTLVDEDALQKFKKIAKDKGVKYQTLLNQVIRGFVATSKNAGVAKPLTEEGVRQIVQQELRKRA